MHIYDITKNEYLNTLISRYFQLVKVSVIGEITELDMRCYIRPGIFFSVVCKYADRTGHGSCQPELDLSGYYPTRRPLTLPELQDILNNVFSCTCTVKSNHY